MHRRGHLRKIYSTWPWARLKREGLPRELVETFPLLHTADYLLNRTRFYPRAASVEVSRINTLLFDEYTLRRVPACDAFVAISGAGLKTGRRVQERGGRFVCDRGSTHQRYQERVLREEYERWGMEGDAKAPHIAVREEEIYAAADAITVPSTMAKRSFVEMGVAAEKVHVIPYGVRLDRFERVGRAPAIKERFEAVFVGQVSLRKGVPYLLEAFARVQHPNKRLRVVGAMDARLEGILGRFPRGSVEFLGAVAQGRLPEILSGSHVLVLPSVEEGLALVQAQAMACGCPVLASTNTGAEDLFTDGREGMIVPIGDVEALVGGMERLIGEAGLQEGMAVAAMERVRSLGGWDGYGDAWEGMLRGLTGRGEDEQR